MTPCMGGWCSVRTRCVHYLEPATRNEPAERLCGKEREMFSPVQTVTPVPEPVVFAAVSRSEPAPEIVTGSKCTATGRHACIAQPVKRPAVKPKPLVFAKLKPSPPRKPVERTGWEPDAPMHITAATKITVAAPMPANHRTSTYSETA